jgi:hypothetical protein
MEEVEEALDQIDVAESLLEEYENIHDMMVSSNISTIDPGILR